MRLARAEAEILEDRAIRLVASAPVPAFPAPLGIRAMRAGKDFLGDKPAVTTLEQLADVRRAVRETGRKFAIMYSERLEVPSAVMAGELVHAGTIGRVVQTVNLAPHRTNAPSRPAWFWDKARYGGILTDIGSHQVDQFVYYTGTRSAPCSRSSSARCRAARTPAACQPRNLRQHVMPEQPSSRGSISHGVPDRSTNT